MKQDIRDLDEDELVCKRNDPNCKVVCKDLKWELAEAKKHIDYMRGRVRDNPLMVPMVGGMHGGTIDWDRQQPFVEELIKENPRDLTDPDFVLNKIRGAQNYNQRTESVVDMANCYIEACGDDGKKCLTSQDARDEFIGCAWHAQYIGKKTIDLMREYLGDDQAVAVDRHVGYWICKDAKVHCPIYDKVMYEIDGEYYPADKFYDFNKKQRRKAKRVHLRVPFDFVKGGSIPDGVYNEIKEALRYKAKECGLTPAHLQVAAWIKGACDAKGNMRVFVGDGYTMRCAERRKEKSLESFLEEIVGE